MLFAKRFPATQNATVQTGGMSHVRIIFRHILPNSVAPVIVQSTLGMGYAVLTEASLGFIGVGIQPPTPFIITRGPGLVKYALLQPYKPHCAHAY